MGYAIGQPSEVVNMGISIPLLAEEGWLRRQPAGCRRSRGGQFGKPFAGWLLRLRPVGLALRATRLRLASLGASTPPLGFAQKILGGHRPPLQLGVRNCRGAL